MISRRNVLAGGVALVARRAQAQEKATMRMSWWGSDDRHTRTLQAIKQWTERNPGLTITPEYGGFLGYQDKLTTQFAGRNAPDIMQIGDNRTALAAAGRLLQLDEYVRSGTLDLHDANAGVLDSVRQDGKLFSLPWGLACGCFFADTKVFADAKVDIPAYGWTWDDYARTARALSGGGRYGSADIWAPAGTRSLRPFEYFLRQRSLVVFKEDGKLGFGAPHLTEWLTFWDELRQAGAVPPPEVTALENGFETSPIIAGRSALYPVNSSIASSLQGLAKNPLVTLPFPNGVGSTALPGPRVGQFVDSSIQVSLNAATRFKPQAVAFLNALINDPALAHIQLMSRGVPLSASMAALVTPEISPVEQAMTRTVGWVADHAVGTVIAWPKTGTPLIDLIQRTHQKVAFGQATVTQAASQFMDEAGQIVE